MLIRKRGPYVRMIDIFRCFSVRCVVYIKNDVLCYHWIHIFIDVAYFCAIMSYEQWNWRFFGFQWLNGHRAVQDWFDELPEDAKEEARDTFAYLQHLPLTLWKKPKFDLLKGAEVSEVRFDTETHTYRIYGYYGPEGMGRQVYTLLYGHDKKTGNDAKGKREAGKRRGYVDRREASVHEFKF
jgi:hypothetical protein